MEYTNPYGTVRHTLSIMNLPKESKIAETLVAQNRQDICKALFGNGVDHVLVGRAGKIVSIINKLACNAVAG